MYYDLLARIKNALRMKRERLTVPFTKFDFAIMQALVRSKFLESVEKRPMGKRQVIDMVFHYRAGEPRITDFKIESKSSRRRYVGSKELRPIRQHFGIAVLSTPKGVLSNREAKKENVGGELLFTIW